MCTVLLIHFRGGVIVFKVDVKYLLAMHLMKFDVQHEFWFHAHCKWVVYIWWCKMEKTEKPSAEVLFGTWRGRCKERAEQNKTMSHSLLIVHDGLCCFVLVLRGENIKTQREETDFSRLSEINSTEIFSHIVFGRFTHLQVSKSR